MMHGILEAAGARENGSRWWQGGASTSILEQVIKWLALSAIPLFAAISVFSARGLYIDGAFYLTMQIRHEDFFFPEPARIHVHIATQLLPLIFVKLGVTDFNAIVRAHTIGLCLLPLAVWAAILWRAARLGNLPTYAMLFAVVYLNGQYSNTESILTYVLTALVFSILLSREPIGLGWGVVGVAACVVLIRSYEAMMFLGLALGAAGIVRWLRDPAPGNRRLLLAMIGLSFFSAIAQIYFFASTQHAEPMSSVTDLRAIWRDPQFTLSVIAGGLFLLAYYHWTGLLTRAAIAIGAVIAILLLVPSLWASPSQTNEMRAFIGIVLFGYLIIISVSEFLRRPAPQNAASIIPLVLLASLSIAHVWHLYGFVKYHRFIEFTVNVRPGVIPFEDIPVERRDAYGPLWAGVPLSWLLQCDHGTHGVIDSPRGYFFQPHPANGPRELPPQYHKTSSLFWTSGLSHVCR